VPASSACSSEGVFALTTKQYYPHKQGRQYVPLRSIFLNMMSKARANLKNKGTLLELVLAPIKIIVLG
jgi:hypothetical protein